MVQWIVGFLKIINNKGVGHTHTHTSPGRETTKAAVDPGRDPLTSSSLFRLYFHVFLFFRKFPSLTPKILRRVWSCCCAVSCRTKDGGRRTEDVPRPSFTDGYQEVRTGVVRKSHREKKTKKKLQIKSPRTMEDVCLLRSTSVGSIVCRWRVFNDQSQLRVMAVFELTC